MSGSRRDFLAQSTLGLLGVAVAAHAQNRRSHRNRHPALRRRSVRAPPVGPGGVGRDLRRGGKAGAGRDDSRRSRRGGGELADADGSAVRAADGTEEAGNWRGCGSGDAVESNAAGVEGKLSGGECVCPQRGQSGCIAWKRRGHRLRHSDAAFALDRGQTDHVGAADGDLYQPYAALRSEAALRDPRWPRITPSNRRGRRTRRLRRAGHRGPLHGIPWGGKDLLDTAEHPDDVGRGAHRDRIPTKDAAVVARRLNAAAGAVLIAKLSLGALALNDIWFGGQTMNPWLLEEGASGSSAGPGAATAAGLVGFSIGSETGGSIVSPSMRCGVTGLRPTFGRVPRTGAITLCWSLHKLGPMARGVEDTMLVLNAITGPDPGDLGSMKSGVLSRRSGISFYLTSQEAHTPQKVLEYMASAEQQLAALGQLTRGPLEFARPVGSRKQVDLVSLFDTALRVNQTKLEAKKIHLVHKQPIRHRS